MINIKYKVNDIKSKGIKVNDFEVKVNTSKLLVNDVSNQR